MINGSVTNHASQEKIHERKGNYHFSIGFEEK